MSNRLAPGGSLVGEVEQQDPALGGFLAFIAQDIQQRPEGRKALTPELAARVAELVAGVAVDLDEPIEGEVAL